MKWEEWNLLTGFLFMVLREVTTGSRVGRAGGKAESSSSAAILGWASGRLGSQGRKAVLSTSINMLTSTYTAANPAGKLRLSKG